MYSHCYEAFLENYSDDLCRFFQDICRQPHEYIAITARRCINLYYLYQAKGYLEDALRERRARIGMLSDDEKPAWIRPMSNNALLIQAEKIAKEYDTTNRFPRILLVDEMLLHGRGLYDTLYAMEKGILFHSRQDYTNPCVRIRMHRDLIRSVDIRIYAMNQHTLALESVLAAQICHEMYCNSTQLRVLSSGITEALLAENIPYTTYVRSRFMQGDIPGTSQNGWRVLKYTYRGIPYMSFMKDGMDQDSKLTILCVPVKNQSGPASFRMTGRYIAPNMKEKDLSERLQRLGSEECLKLRDYFPEYLLYPSVQAPENHRLPAPLHYLRWQIFSFIISAALVNAFSADYGLESEDFSGRYGPKMEIQKYADNFGITVEQIEKLLGSIREKYQMCLEGIEASYDKQTDQVWLSQEELDSIVRACEDVMYYKGGMEAERKAFEIEQKGLLYNPGIPQKNLMKLSDFYSDAGSPSCYGGTVSDALAFCTNIFSEVGILSMNAEYNAGCKESEQQYDICLKAGELATFIIPQRISIFIPALSEIEMRYWVNVDRLKGKILKYVRDLSVLDEVQKGYPENVRVYVSEQSKYLKEHCSDILDGIYKSGHTFTGWDLRWEFDEKSGNNQDPDYAISAIYQRDARRFCYHNLNCTNSGE